MSSKDYFDRVAQDWDEMRKISSLMKSEWQHFLPSKKAKLPLTLAQAQALSLKV